MPKNQPPPAARGIGSWPASPRPNTAASLPLLKPVKLAFNQVLYEPRGPIDYAYFPTGAVLSALTVMQDGNAIEVATVGNEGLVGPLRLRRQDLAQQGHRADRRRGPPHRGAGPAGGGRRGTARSGTCWTAYHIAFMAQVSQSVACNGLHRLEQRCCRWLLMTRDRVGSDDLRLTHEYLAIMLGATAGERHRGPRAAPGGGPGPVPPGPHQHPRRRGAGGPLVRVLPRREGRVRPAAGQSYVTAATMECGPVVPHGRSGLRRDAAGRPGVSSRLQDGTVNAWGAAWSILVRSQSAWRARPGRVVSQDGLHLRVAERVGGLHEQLVGELHLLREQPQVVQVADEAEPAASRPVEEGVVEGVRLALPGLADTVR